MVLEAWKPSAGIPLQVPSLQRCDMIPLCHLGRFRSLFPFPQSFWLQISLHYGQWYNLCFSMPSSLLQPLHFFASDQPLSYNLFCTHPPSTTSFVVTCRCLSAHTSLVVLRSIAWTGFNRTLPSTRHSCALLPISSNRPSLLVSEASFSRPAGTPLSCPPPPALRT